jgi:hypothetical protein
MSEELPLFKKIPGGYNPQKLPFIEMCDVYSLYLVYINTILFTARKSLNISSALKLKNFYFFFFNVRSICVYPTVLQTVIISLNST